MICWPDEDTVAQLGNAKWRIATNYVYWGCQLLVGRSLTKHLHHRPYLLRENIVSSVITAVTQLSNWEMWETASNKLGGGLELPNPRILLYKR